MPLNILRPQQPVLAPFVLVSLSSNAAMNDRAVVTLLKEWVGSGVDASSQWSTIAESNKLIYDSERNQAPFQVSEVYEGEQRWATVLKHGTDQLELYLGLRIRTVGNIPSQREVADSVQHLIPRLAKQGRRRFWQPVAISAELMVNRTGSDIRLTLAPSYAKTLVSGDVLKSFLPLGVASLGWLISALQTREIGNVAQARIIAFPVLTFFIAYLLVALLHWFSSKSDLKWVLGRS